MRGPEAEWGPVALRVFEACVAAIPYAPAAAFLGREKARMSPREGGPARVALVADGVGTVHGVTRTIEEIRERGVPGFEIEVIGTDPNVDRRLAAATEVEVPFYPGLRVGVPGLPAVVDAIAEGGYDVVHLCTPGPAGVVAGLVARSMDLPVVGSYHTELAAYARMRSGDPGIEAGMVTALGVFYGACGHVLSPSGASDEALAGLGIAGDRIGRWDRGVDTARFDPARREALMFAPPPGEPPAINVLYAGRLTREKGIGLLADAFEEALAIDRRLHLVVAGGGPEEATLRRRLGPAATFLGWLEGHALAAAYASADLFLFCSVTDTFGQVILEAQASGLPVVAVATGGPAELIEDGRSGLLCPPDARALADAVTGLAASRAARDRLARGGLAAVRRRTWERSLEQLAAGYRSALAPTDATGVRRAA
jgi:glycosyltransferase involved in cell wall biosynthesis